MPLLPTPVLLYVPLRILILTIHNQQDIACVVFLLPSFALEDLIIRYFKAVVLYEEEWRNLLPPLHSPPRTVACASGSLERREDEGRRRKGLLWGRLPEHRGGMLPDVTEASLSSLNSSTEMGELKPPGSTFPILYPFFYTLLLTDLHMFSCRLRWFGGNKTGWCFAVWVDAPGVHATSVANRSLGRIR